MERFTREDIEQIVNAPGLPDTEIKKILREELKLNIPEELTKEELTEFVYSEYCKALEEIEEKREEARKEFEKKKIKRKKEKKAKNPSKKSQILGFIKENKYTRKQLIEKVDGELGYKVRGKSSKTRVSRCIKDFEINKLVKISPSGILRYTGEKE